MFHLHMNGSRGPRGRFGGWRYGGDDECGFAGMRESIGDAVRGAAIRDAVMRGSRRRLFDGGELRLVLLKLIADQPRHGYDLIRDIEARTGGAYAPSPGVIYPTLTLLADMSLIDEAPSEGARKLFAIAQAGAALLEEKAGEVAALFARLDAMGAERARTDSAPVRRALGNLRAVLANRASADGFTPETQHDVAALLDEVARKIERM